MTLRKDAQDEAPSMIVVMGVTGAGKSHFINQLAGKEVVQEGADLDSCELLHSGNELYADYGRYAGLWVGTCVDRQ